MFLEFMGSIFVGILIASFVFWVIGISIKVNELEKRLDKQNEINQHFKLKKEYREDYDE